MLDYQRLQFVWINIFGLWWSWCCIGVWNPWQVELRICQQIMICSNKIFVQILVWTNILSTDKTALASRIQTLEALATWVEVVISANYVTTDLAPVNQHHWISAESSSHMLNELMWHWGCNYNCQLICLSKSWPFLDWEQRLWHLGKVERVI